jgi:PKD repeat protein
MSKQFLKIRYLTLLLVIVCFTEALHGQGRQREPGEVTQKMTEIRAYFDENFPRYQNDKYSIDLEFKKSDWLSQKVPGARFLLAYAKFMAPARTGSFLFWNGKLYPLPEEFNRFTRDAGIILENSNDAVGLAALYAQTWEPSGAEGLPAAMILSSSREIPHRVGKIDPSLEDKVIPPRIEFSSGRYIVNFFSWSPMGGWVRNWNIELSGRGEVQQANQKIIARFVGDFIREGAIEDRNPDKEPRISFRDAPVEETEDVLIGGTTRFVIHWRDDDFGTTADGTSAEVVNWVKNACINSWNYLIVNLGFSVPPDADGTIHVYIWNDSTGWGPHPAGSGFGAYYTMSGGEQFIYIQNCRLDWWEPMDVYWPTIQDAYTGGVGHEFMHCVQEGYGVMDTNQWFYEGIARFFPTILIPNGEFWQNSMLAGLTGGPYNQEADHRSLFIRQSLSYLSDYPTERLYSTSYSGCAFWRYLYEHYGDFGHSDGETLIRSIFEQVLSDAPLTLFDDQIASVNAVLGGGVTDMAFADFGLGTLLEFNDLPFNRLGDFFQYSNRYYEDVAMGSRSITLSSTFPVNVNDSISPYSSWFTRIDPDGIPKLQLAFDGEDTASYQVHGVLADGAVYSLEDFVLNGNNEGSIVVNDANLLDGLIVAVVRNSTSGGTGSFGLELQMLNTSPVADANGPYTANEGSMVTFDGSGSSDPEGDTLNYRWDFDMDSVWDTSWMTSSTTGHTYADDWSGSVTLQVTDGEFNVSDSAAVTILNVAPTADAGIDLTANEGATVNFSGSFTDPGAEDTHTLDWDFGDGNLASGSLSPTHEYGDNGSFSVTFTVQDDDGGVGNDTLTVTVDNVAPSVTLDPVSQPNPHFILPGVHELSFNGQFTDPGWLDTHSGQWDFGDGTVEAASLTEENEPPDATGTATGSHIYSVSGDFTVGLTVTDDDGGSDSDTMSLHVVTPEEAIGILNSYIQALPDEYFKNNPANRKNAFANKLAEMILKVTEGDYQGASQSLLKDVGSLCDGIGKNDWIIDPLAQVAITQMVQDIYVYLQSLI